jgi:predicted PurR-regulated permease PerM
MMSDSKRWFILLVVIALVALVYLLSPILVPFLVSFLLAYFLNPVVSRLSKWHVPRFLAAFAVFIIAIAVITIALFWLVPRLEAQIVLLIQKVPQMIAWVQNTLIPWFDQEFHLDLAANVAFIKQQLLQHLNDQGGNFAQIAIKTAFNSSYKALEILMNLILIPVVTLYLLCDWQKVTTKGAEFLPVAAENRESTVDLIRQCGDVLAAFLRGQLLVMIGLGIVYSIGLSIVGLDLALLIGIGAGLLSIVPYLGFIVGLLIAVITALIQFGGGLHLVYVLIVFAIGTCCENFIFSPWFVGDRIGLHPVAVIFAVLAGGKLFGFVGVLLALPAAAVIMVFVRHLQKHYFDSEKQVCQNNSP